jgi:uncharacterized small protein (DUF1192 family)
MFDEELQEYKDRISRLEEKVERLKAECTKREKIIAQLAPFNPSPSQ